VAWRGEAISDIIALSRGKYSLEEFRQDCDRLLFKWTVVDRGKFSKYLCRTWIGSYAPSYCRTIGILEASFPPKIWAATLIEPDLYSKIDYTNNQAERYHERLNSLFQRKPGIKKFIWVLRRIENNYRTTHLFNVQNFSNVLWKPENEEDVSREFRFSDLRVAQPRLLDENPPEGQLEIESDYFVEHPTETNQQQPTSNLIQQINPLSVYSPSPVVYESRTAINKSKRRKRKELDPLQRALQQIDSQEQRMSLSDLAQAFTNK
jgi:hypothetical protein